MLAIEVDDRVLKQSDLGVAYSQIDPTYRGPCRMVASGRTQESVVFPDAGEAECAAIFAVGDLGGYHTSRVEPAPGAMPTHPSWTSWAFES